MSSTGVVIVLCSSASQQALHVRLLLCAHCKYNVFFRNVIMWIMSDYCTCRAAIVHLDTRRTHKAMKDLTHTHTRRDTYNTLQKQSGPLTSTLNHSNIFCLFMLFPPYCCIIFPWLWCLSCKTSLYSNQRYQLTLETPLPVFGYERYGQEFLYVRHNWVSDAVKSLLSEFKFGNMLCVHGNTLRYSLNLKQWGVVAWCCRLWTVVSV